GPGVLTGRHHQPGSEAAHVLPAPPRPAGAPGVHGADEHQVVPSSPEADHRTRQRGHPDFTVHDLVRAAESGEGAVAEMLHERLEYVEQTKLLGPQGTSLNELVKEGEATLINLRGTAPDVQELVVARIASTLFDNRKRGKIPPLFLVI